MLNGSRVSDSGWVELGKACVSVVVESCVTVTVDSSGGFVDITVSISVRLSVIVVVDTCAGKVVASINVEVAGAAAPPEPGITRFLKAT